MPEETNTPRTEGATNETPAPANLATVETQDHGTKLENQSPAPQPPAEADERSLVELTQAAAKGRLSDASEERATMLMHDALLSGGEAFLGAVDAMPQLPWILAVRAIEQAWPKLVPEARPFLLSGLAKMEGIPGARLRLSVSRALMKIELPVAVKIAATVCLEMVNPETGMLNAEQSKLIGNVFIGRGKPWVLQFPLESLDEAESTAMVAALVFSVFNVNNPPITQLSILRFGAARLGSMHPNLQEMVAKNVERWNGKWQVALRRDCPVLPEIIAAALKPQRGGDNAPAQPSSQHDDDAGEAETQPPLPKELEEKLKLAAEAGDPDAVAAATKEINTWLDVQRTNRPQPREQQEEQPAEREDDRRSRGRGRGRDRDRDRERPPENQPRERPTYVSREQERSGGPAPFNLTEALRGIDKYVSQLRNDLSAAQVRIRRAEEGGGRRRSSDRAILSVEEANLSTDELKRLVIQLEARVADQESRIAELTSDSEMRADSMAPGADGKEPDAITQLRTFLAMKLSDDWADYLALENQNQEPDIVVKQHYRSIIRRIFGALIAEGVALTPKAELPPPPPEILPPPPTPVIEEEEEDEDDEELDAIPEPELDNLDDDEDDDDDSAEPVATDSTEDSTEPDAKPTS